jgi:hypothetical protein
MTINVNIFDQINNAVLDLQNSHLQSYERPLKTLARLLHHPDLEAVNRSLTEGVDYDALRVLTEDSLEGR